MIYVYLFVSSLLSVAAINFTVIVGTRSLHHNLTVVAGSLIGSALGMYFGGQFR